MKRLRPACLTLLLLAAGAACAAQTPTPVLAIHGGAGLQRETGGNETIKQAVIAGMGISLLSRHTLTLELAHGQLAILAVDGMPVMRSWHVAHRTGKRLPPAALALRAFILAQGGDFLRQEYGEDVRTARRIADDAARPG